MAKRKNCGQGAFCVGDRVEILRYETEISWGDRTPQRYGFVVAVDGAYILVRPRWWPQGDAVERYPSELRKAPLARA